MPPKPLPPNTYLIMRGSLVFMTLLAIGVLGAYVRPILSPRQEIYTTEPEANAWVRLDPLQQILLNGELFSVRVSLNSPNIAIRDAVAVLRYSASILEVDTIYFSQHSSSREVAFDRDQGAVRLSSRFEHGLVGLETVWVEIVFKSLRAGEALIAIDCAPGQIYETNLVTDTQRDIVHCGQSTATKTQVHVAATEMTTGKLCSNSVPAPPRQILAVPGPKARQITLSWELPVNSTHTSLVYGKDKGEYPFGVPRIPRHPDGQLWQHFTVGELEPGQNYFFVLTSLDSCAISRPSEVISSLTSPLAMDEPLSATGSAAQPLIPPFSFSLMMLDPNKPLAQFWTMATELVAFTARPMVVDDLAIVATDKLIWFWMTVLLLVIVVICMVWVKLSKRSTIDSAQIIRKRYAHLDKDN